MTFVCDYDFTRPAVELSAMEYFVDMLGGTFQYHRYKLISEEEFVSKRDYSTLTTIVALSALSIFNEGKYVELVLHPGLNGETWFYYEMID